MPALSRRETLQICGATTALALTGCTDPVMSRIRECAHSIPAEPAGGGDGFPTLSVAEAMPKAIREEYSAAVWVETQYSDSEVAKLCIEVLNERHESREDVWGSTPPFSSYRGEHTEHDAAMYIVPSPPEGTHAGISHVDAVEDVYTAGADLAEPIEGCWPVENVASNDIASSVSLGPCESFDKTYSVYAAAENDGCLPTGRYRFDGSYWGFDVRVEE